MAIDKPEEWKMLSWQCIFVAVSRPSVAACRGAGKAALSGMLSLLVRSRLCL